jgi:hypothetical protein
MQFVPSAFMYRQQHLRLERDARFWLHFHNNTKKMKLRRPVWLLMQVKCHTVFIESCQVCHGINT